MGRIWCKECGTTIEGLGDFCKDCERGEEGVEGRSKWLESLANL